MKVSNKGIIALALHEGVVPAPYYDSVGVLTYGVGHTSAAGEPHPMNMGYDMPKDLDVAYKKVFEVFKKDLEKYSAEVNKAIYRPMYQSEFDAAVSFHYNTGAIKRATWVKTFNAGNRALAAKQIMNWSKPKAIINRRKAEQRLFLEGIYPEGNIPVWEVKACKLTGKMIGRLTSERILSYLEPKKTQAPFINLILALIKAFTMPKLNVRDID